METRETGSFATPRCTDATTWHGSCSYDVTVQAAFGTTTLTTQEEAIRKFTVNLLGAAALAAAGIALLRQGNHRLEPVEAKVDEVPPGETIPGKIRLEKLRELGI